VNMTYINVSINPNAKTSMPLFHMLDTVAEKLLHGIHVISNFKERDGLAKGDVRPGDATDSKIVA